MENKRRNKSLKKIMILSFAAVVLGIGVLTAFVFVLALPTRNVVSGVSVDYVAVDVSARITGYSKLGSNAEILLQSDPVVFDYSERSFNKPLNPTNNYTLTAGQTMVFKYKIENMGGNDFEILLDSAPSGLDVNNMTITYKISSSGNDYTNISSATLPTASNANVVAGYGTKYVYIQIAITNSDSSASLRGGFLFRLQDIDD